MITISSTRENSGSLTPEWHQKLEMSGLTVLDRSVPAGFPDVMSAIYSVNGVEVEPSVVISDELPDAARELDLRWEAQAAAVRLVSSDGEFYILAPDARGHEIGWIRVKDTTGKNLPSRIASGTGNIEFLTVSTDGRVMCAVSTEESEKWIVVHRFPAEARES
ncbi:hypothetical protein [Streptomyces sp. NPDC058326]|uniref:hypothetical protein n=1 Tax=Streptomyces sp. NPDC058326 TaxID=3346447 RepID=UPI0036E294CA